MKFLGVGLSKTGTTSLYRALKILGYKCIHFDQSRLNDILDGSNSNPAFNRYDDVDAVLDIPTAYFYKELLQVYPEAKAILTLRDLDSWWASINHHFNDLDPILEPNLFDRFALKLRFNTWPKSQQYQYNLFRKRLRNLVYGSPTAQEFLYKKRFIDHNRRVQEEISKDRLLVMDIVNGDGWEVLCPFIEAEIPNTEFPHAKKRAS